MFILGVTGTSGSGKTLFCAYLAELGAAVIDCDRVYHDLLKNSIELNRNIISAFPGAEINGFADRRALAGIVFADKALLKRLEDVVFPHIAAKIEQILTELEIGGAALAVLDAPTLFESGGDRLCARIIAMTSDVETQIERLARREELSRDEALARISSRPGPEFYIERGCEIIYNDGDIGKIRDEAARIYHSICGKGEE